MHRLKSSSALLNLAIEPGGKTGHGPLECHIRGCQGQLECHMNPRLPLTEKTNIIQSNDASFSMNEAQLIHGW